MAARPPFPPETPPADVPEPEVRRSPWPRLPVLWLIPLVAGLVSAWLVWTTWAEQGPVVSVRFRTAEGVEPGKTPVRFREVDVGTVKRVRISDDLKSVIVTLQLVAGAERLLAPDTRFWVVRPRIGIGGVSGLGTLISGPYIAVDPGSGGGPVYAFTGLEEPPLIRSDVPGTRFELEATRLSGVDRGSPVYFRGIEVGQVLGYELAEDGRRVRIFVFVRAPYDRLVRTTTRFWNASGAEIGAGPEGFGIRLESVQTLLVGGIAFDSFGSAQAEPAAGGARFVLYESEQAARESTVAERLRARVNFAGSVRGLRPGSPVELQGIRVGRVAEVRLHVRPESAQVLVTAVLEIDPGRFGLSGPAGAEAVDPLARLVARGLHARLATGNLLTGEALVELVFVPDAVPAEVAREDGEPVIPALPTQLEALTGSLAALLERLSALPLERLVADMSDAARGVGELARSPDLAATLAAARSAAEDLAETVRTLRRDLAPVAPALSDVARRAADAAERAGRAFAALEQLVGPGSRTREDVVELVRELRAAARSIRLFAEYLERNPQALIRGRSP